MNTRLKPLGLPTALMVRLWVEREGSGDLMASVPQGLGELAERLTAENPVGGDRFGFRAGRITFVMREDAWRFLSDVREIPLVVLRENRALMTEVLDRIAVSGFKTKVLLQEEFEYLQHALGEGAWCRRLEFVAA